MNARPRRRDGKIEALRAQGALHPHPETVHDLWGAEIRFA
jgi:hypothetical protein